MSAIRPQYHLKPAQAGCDAWEIRRLVELSRGLPIRMVDPHGFAELHEDHWYFHTSARPTPSSLIEHMRLIQACDVSFPIILDANGRVMDGMHRICRAVLDGLREIPAVQFTENPPPDFTNCDPDELPYE